MTASTANLWAVAGLVYALAGAALLALSIFAAPQPSAQVASRDLRTSVEQWLDARIGAVLIAVGFFLQATGAVGTATLNTPAVFLLLGLALAAGYYALSKDLIVEDLTASFAAAPPSQEVALADPVAAVAPVVLVAAEPPVTVIEAEQVVIDLRPRESTG
jgi:hypothetical protein